MLLPLLPFLLGTAYLLYRFPLPLPDTAFALTLTLAVPLANALLRSQFPAPPTAATPARFKHLSVNAALMRAFIATSLLVSVVLPWVAVAGGLADGWVVRNLFLMMVQGGLETGTTGVAWWTKTVRFAVPLLFVAYRLPVLYGWTVEGGGGEAVRLLARINLVHWTTAYLLFFLPFVYPNNFVLDGED